MSDTSAKSYLLAFINPVEGKEAEFNEWYTNIHLLEVVAVEGIFSAQRFTLSDKQVAEDQPHKYLAMYEIEYGNEDKVIDNLNAAIPTMDMQPLAHFEKAHSMVVKSISALVTS